MSGDALVAAGACSWHLVGGLGVLFNSPWYMGQYSTQKYYSAQDANRAESEELWFSLRFTDSRGGKLIFPRSRQCSPF